jgi:hypothetical protein
MSDRAKVAAEIARDIRRELVCCDIYEERHQFGGYPQAHAICYWGEAAARIADSHATLIAKADGAVPVSDTRSDGVRQRKTARLLRTMASRVQHMASGRVAADWLRTAAQSFDEYADELAAVSDSPPGVMAGYEADASRLGSGAQDTQNPGLSSPEEPR